MSGTRILSPKMKSPKSNQPRRLEYNTLGDGVTAFSTLRDTTRADDPYGGFNACYYTHGDPSRVAACRHILSAATHDSHIVMPRQQHTNLVAYIDSANAPDPEGVDALVTSLPGVALAINTADCVPVLMADSTSGIIAAVHSGWRGTVGHIVRHTLDIMLAHGATYNNVKVVMGPSICSDCFEVGNEVAEQFDREFGHGHDIVLTRPDWRRPHIDLRRAIALDLIRAGLPAVNIDSSTAPCSHCNPADWWSARRLGINSGRTTTLIVL